MLGRLLDDLWKSRMVHVEKASAPHTEFVWPVKSRVAPKDSRLIAGFTGAARSGAFLGPMTALGGLFEQAGYRFQLVNFESQDCSAQLLNAMREGVRCIVAPAAAGLRLFPEFPGCPWAASGVPFVKLLGDHPAYFPDRHRQNSPAHVNLYVYPDHLDFFERRVRGPTMSEGIGATMPVVSLIPARTDTSAISRRRNGRLAFYKNGNNPETLRRAWVDRLPGGVATLLNCAADELLAQMDKRSSVLAVEQAVDTVMRGSNVSSLLPYDLLCFLNAQLDDYLRREKSTLIGRVLARYPVDIYGDFWEHVDFSRGAAVWRGGGDYQKMMSELPNYIAVVDMSPNGEGAVHERVSYAASLKTVCLTNATPFLSENFPELAQYAFSFSADSIASAVEKAITDPQQTVEAGFAAASRFERHHPGANYVKTIIDTADLAMTRLTRPVVQDFCIWP